MENSTFPPSPSNSVLVPYVDRHLATSPPVTAVAASRLRIPCGWRVEEVPRQDGTRSDMYYYEPGTGKKFRSKAAVYRHLNGEELIPRRSTRNKKPSIHDHVKFLEFGAGSFQVVRWGSPSTSLYVMPHFTFYKSLCLKRQGKIGIVHAVKNSCPNIELFRLDDEPSQSRAIVASEKVPQAPDVLPDGWIVKEFPRRRDNWTDKYYYDPETGQRFRSLVAIDRYLTEMEENAPLSEALEGLKKIKHRSKNSPQVKKNIFEDNAQASSFGCPPLRVNWVLASPEGNAWNPFLSDTRLSNNGLKDSYFS